MGIRPEGFLLDDKGAMCCKLTGVEVMGRDSSVISTHPALEGTEIRSIISADSKVNEQAETVRFTLKPHKVHIFDKETEERIYFEAD